MQCATRRCLWCSPDLAGLLRNGPTAFWLRPSPTSPKSDLAFGCTHYLMHDTIFKPDTFAAPNRRIKMNRARGWVSQPVRNWHQGRVKIHSDWISAQLRARTHVRETHAFVAGHREDRWPSSLRTATPSTASSSSPCQPSRPEPHCSRVDGQIGDTLRHPRNSIRAREG